MATLLGRRTFIGGSVSYGLMAAAPSLAAAKLTALKRHSFLLTGEWDHRKADQTIFVVRGGKVTWSYSVPLKEADGAGNELGDATMAANGNVLFAYKSGAREVTPDKRIVWDIKAPDNAEIHTLQPMGADHAMVVQNGNPATLMIINRRTGAVETSFALPVPNPDKPHIQFRRVRVTPQGTFLAGHLDDKKVVEYDQSGKAIWTYAIDRPWGVHRLKTGNTLISSYNADKATEVVEVTPSGEVVWRFSQTDVPDWACFQFQGVTRLANGNTLICNWCAGALKDIAKWPGTAQVFEVRPDKSLAWVLNAWDMPDLGTASSIQLLDQPGGYGICA